MKRNGKNAKGAGTVYFSESEDKWRSEISWTDENGEKHTKKFSGYTKREVSEKLEAFKLRKAERDKRHQADKEWHDKVRSAGGCMASFAHENYSMPTFREFSTRWFETFEKPRLKPASCARIKVGLENQVYPYIGDMKMEEICFFDIQSMVNKIIGSGLSYSTAKKAYEIVNSCYKIYRINYRSNHNPCEGVRLPHNNKKPISDIEFFDEHECKMICEEAVRCYDNGTPVYRYGYVIIALMYTGLRIGEFLALTWDDIDFVHKYITVNKNVVCVKDEKEKKMVLLNQDSTKTKSGNRIVPFCSTSEKAFIELKKLRCKNSKYVVCTQSGAQVFPRNINRTFHCILTKVGLYSKCSKYSRGVHILRHTFASILFKNGCETKVVSQLLGHSDTKITENIYIHLTKDFIKSKAVDIEEYFKNIF